MAENTGRLHVHLHDLKEKLKERHPVHGEVSQFVREIVQAYVEDRYMILDEKVLAIIDKGNFDEAVDLLLPGLQKLREERLQVGQKAVATRTKTKEDKGKKAAGIKTDQEKLAQKMYEQLLGGFS